MTVHVVGLIKLLSTSPIAEVPRQGSWATVLREVLGQQLWWHAICVHSYATTAAALCALIGINSMVT